MRPSRSSPRSPRTPRVAERFAIGSLVGLVGLVGLASAGCEDKKPHAPDASVGMATSDASASDAGPATSASPAPSHVAPAPRAEGPCRILEGGGPIHGAGDAGAPLRAGSTLKRGEAFELGAEAVATVKDPESGRELRFEGPALAVPCADHDETWLVRGRLVMRPGTADQPLSELAVVVREGVVTLGSGAYVKIEAKPTGTELRTNARRPTIWPAAEAKVAWTPRGDGSPDDVATLTIPTSAATAARAKTDCDTLGKESADLAARMLDKDASLSELSPKSLVAQKNARSACAVAKMRALAAR